MKLGDFVKVLGSNVILDIYTFEDDVENMIYCGLADGVPNKLLSVEFFRVFGSSSSLPNTIEICV